MIITLSLLNIMIFAQYADPVLDKLDIHQVVSHRLFRESCYNHKGNYVKVSLAFCVRRSLFADSGDDRTYPNSAAQ